MKNKKNVFLKTFDQKVKGFFDQKEYYCQVLNVNKKFECLNINSEDYPLINISEKVYQDVKTNCKEIIIITGSIDENVKLLIDELITKNHDVKINVFGVRNYQNDQEFLAFKKSFEKNILIRKNDLIGINEVCFENLDVKKIFFNLDIFDYSLNENATYFGVYMNDFAFLLKNFRKLKFLQYINVVTGSSINYKLLECVIGNLGAVLNI